MKASATFCVSFNFYCFS